MHKCAYRRKSWALRIVAAGAAALAAAPVLAQESPAGRFTFELRPRYNHIEESDKPKRTTGGTVRILAGYASAPIDGMMRIVLEGIHADQIDPHFNDNGADFATSPYPLLPDPKYTGINRAYIDFTGIESARVRAGRQVVRMDNQRWVSDNNFRQTPQVFDGINARYATPFGVELQAAYFGQVRTTSGDADDLNLTLLHAAWNPLPGHALVAYGYFHDQPSNGAFTGFANSSYRVAGVRAEGTAFRAGEFDFPYEAEVAWQRPYAGGDSRIDAKYWRLGGGAACDWGVLRYDYEVKGSNGGRYGVQMPLTDFYAFNGWTLHFFNTPRQGLRDGWITLKAVWQNFTFYGESHRFRSDYGSIDFGKELDVGLTYSWNENMTLRVQNARYDPGSNTPDPTIRKVWVTFTWTY
jgi:hypothetical protein